MDQLVRQGVIARDGLEIRPRGDALIIAGEIQVDGGAVIRVHKEIRKVEDRGNTPWVQTHAYTYNVYIPDRGVLVRHDGPDHHKPYHHRHDYDPLGGKGTTTRDVKVDWDDVPTLG